MRPLVSSDQLPLFEHGGPVWRPGQIPDKTDTCPQCWQTIIVSLYDERSGQQLSGYRGEDGRCYDCTFKVKPRKKPRPRGCIPILGGVVCYR